MRTTRLIRLLFLCLNLFPAYALAQDYVYAVGNTPFGVNIPIENGFINVANGNLHMEFPFATHKQRGALSLNERLVYDSRIWRILPPTSTTIYYGFFPSNIPDAPDTQGGWRFVTSGEAGITTLTDVGKSIPCGDNGGYTTRTHTSFAWTDPSGTSHPFDAGWTTMYSDCNITPVSESSSGWATDASGYSIKVSGMNDAAPDSITVWDNDGNIVNRNTMPSVIDRYGNYFSLDSSGNLIDTLGRIPVIATQNGNVTYYDVLAPNGPINNSGTRVRYTVTTSPVTISTHFNQSAVSEWEGTFYPVQSIQLPDGTSYSFTYDTYGEMTSITLPTGGVINYGWTNYQDSYNNINRWLTSRTVGSNSAMTFTPSVITQCASNGTGCQEKVVVHKPSGDETSYELTLNNGAWNTKVDAYTGPVSGTPPISITNTYSFQCSGCDSSYITKSSSVTTLSNGLQSQQQYVYDSPSLGKPTKVKEWDYFTGSPSQTPTRETDYVYTGFDLSQATVFNNGVQTTQTTYDYTTSAATTSGISQHGTVNAGGPYLLKVTQWLNGGTSPYTTYGMDDTGMVISVIDPKQNPATSISYQCGNSLPYQVTNPLGHVTTYGYDCNSGAITSVKDPNDAAANRAGTTYQYEGGAGRVQSISYPNGGQKSYSYPSTVEVDTSVIATPDPTITSQDIVDSFGRPYQHIQAGISTETTYDANGRVSCMSNPHYSNPSSTDGTTCITIYDGLDRPKTQIQPDGNTLTWSYSGNTVISSDEATHSWQRTSDAFGRLTKVIEPNGAETDYSYNLWTTKVSQMGIVGSETTRADRTFTTDSLGRTVNVTEPESGTTTYGYDNNGNLTTKTDARGISTTYSYDTLNRLTDVNYSNGTPGRHYGYDFTSSWMGPQYNTIGRLSQSFSATDPNYAGSVPSPASPYNWSDELYSYDAVGRVVRIGTAFPSESGHAAHETDIAYDLAGNMTALRYPDGRFITQGFDGNDRLQNVTYDNWNGQHVGYTYAAGFTYTPAGAQTEVNYGDNVYIHTPYNNRQQMCQVWSSGSKGWIDTHIYYGSEVFCNNTPGNNGNISEIKDWKNPNRTKYFGYDNLNRLSSFNTGGASQNYGYDSFGNLTQSGTQNFQVNYDTNNRISSGGFGYDAIGNLAQTNVAGINSSYAFDGAGRMINFNSGTEYYTYDGNGNRVRKDVNGTYTEYQYLNGQPIAERHSDGTWSDYIYANGQKIAKADTFDKALRLSGTSTGAGGYSWFHLNGDGGLAGYIIQSGDMLYLRDFQSGPINGAVAINMADGTNIGGLTDQDGYPAGADSFTGDWHLRRIDLTPMAGHTIGQVFFGATYNQNGDWQESFADAALFGADGTVHPLYTGQPTANVSLTWQSNMTNLSADVASYGTFQNTFYYISDQVGSTRMIMNGGSNGWPVGQEEYYPFGQKANNNSSAAQNAYLFTGLEHDGESGLDHATFRQYSSAQGRWISPDPYSGSYDFTNPQSFNRYSYVGNSPLAAIDPTGLSPEGGSSNPAGGCIGAVALGGQNPVADVGCIASFLNNWFRGLFGLLGGPSFNGSLTPRPSGAIWDEHGGFNAKPYSSIAGMIGDVDGLYSPGCEFGACGGGFTQGAGNSITVLASPSFGLAYFVNDLINRIHLPYADASDPNHRLFGTHYCGPGGGGGTTSGLDQLCAAHDACYRANGVSAIDNLNPFTSGSAMGGCDRLLCAELSNYSPKNRPEAIGKSQIQQVFGCGYINK